MPIRLVIFDLDGTLIQSNIQYEEIRKRLKYMLREYLSEQDYKEILEKKISILELIELIERFSQDEEKSKNALKIVEDFEFKGYKDAYVFPETYEVLKRLKKMGINIAILTNNSRNLTSYALKHYNLSEFIDAVVTRDDIEKRKPDPEGLNMLIEKFGVDKNECIFIGDAWLDAEAANNAQIKFIRFLPKEEAASRQKAHANSVIITKLSEIFLYI